MTAQLRHGAREPVGERRDDLPIEELDDRRDREELRTRYYGVIQELRVLLPGVQILVAFLLAAPFSQRFGDLDEIGRQLYVIGLTLALLSGVMFMTPAAFHRVGDRRARVQRLRTAMRMTRWGLGFLGLSLLTCGLVVIRFVFDTVEAAILTGVVAAAMAWMWVLHPFLASRHHARRRRDGSD